jgi:hypothetical protein
VKRRKKSEGGRSEGRRKKGRKKGERELDWLKKHLKSTLSDNSALSSKLQTKSSQFQKPVTQNI